MSRYHINTPKCPGCETGDLHITAATQNRFMFIWECDACTAQYDQATGQAITIATVAKKELTHAFR